ncbi:RES domain-containing protein [Gramella sp. Hel_I_59]|uniref:RES family NAD+ phosphorylase n=1 Tax=Gramella sp. Hel_I_59 TaxID=1249978 RepID=UPI001152B432|nr:RES family NAD+ phosphorylase [Gramella sp. Hel_I_59]TQI71146.1 RES domain-containing protein [Gramella sp. Hel_I_59]
MKIYRAIEFSQLIWLTSDYAKLVWESLSFDEAKKLQNWWFYDEHLENKRLIIKDICDNSSTDFFTKSLDYNAMQGGRFNPSKSFGVIYSSNHPLVSALEVLYHQFDGALPLYSRMKKNNRKFTSTFNVKIPRKLESLIIAFEIEIDEDLCTKEICNDEEGLKDLCQTIGFNRYIGDNFGRDFIFGNDYEISRLLGTYLHTEEDGSFKVPSARIDYEFQDEKKIRNFIIPEKNYDNSKIKLTGNFFEFECNIDLESSNHSEHPVSIKLEGKNGKENLSFSLDPKPSKRYTKNQFIKYLPTTGNNDDRKNHYREVEIQKFKEN